MGLLVAFLSDILQDVACRASPEMFVPSPRATTDDSVWAYLKDAGTLSGDLLEAHP